MKNKVQYFVSIALLALISFSTSLMAQPPDPHGGSDCNPPTGGGAPISGGIGILIALAMAYGISRWYFKNRQNTSHE